MPSSADSPTSRSNSTRAVEKAHLVEQLTPLRLGIVAADASIRPAVPLAG
jgi:hypothetical protein